MRAPVLMVVVRDGIGTPGALAGHVRPKPRGYRSQSRPSQRTAATGPRVARGTRGQSRRRDANEGSGQRATDLHVRQSKQRES